MNTLRNTLTTLLATAAIATATSASALPQGWGDYLPSWTATASSCSVDESSTGKYEFSGAQFRYLADNISNYGVFTSNTVASSNIFVIAQPKPTYQPITVRCNVTPIYDYVSAIPAAEGSLFGTPAYWKSADWNALIVGHKDTDGISAKAQVSVSLRKVSRATLGETTLATFNSNLSATVAANEDIKQFTHTFDFQNNSYYVEINLVRTDTTVATPVAYSVRLAKGEFAAIVH